MKRRLEDIPQLLSLLTGRLARLESTLQTLIESSERLEKKINRDTRPGRKTPQTHEVTQVHASLEQLQKASQTLRSVLRSAA